jgi:hypothetical protein
MSFRKLLCLLTLLAFTAIAGVGCTGPADNGGTTPPPSSGSSPNTTNN